MQQAIKLDYKNVLENKSRFVLVHASSGFKHALKGRPSVGGLFSVFHLRST